jgi:hypothetical protein
MHSQLDAALTIIGHERWEDAMKYDTKATLRSSQHHSAHAKDGEPSIVMTPMKRMIQYLPDAALAVLNVSKRKLLLRTVVLTSACIAAVSNPSQSQHAELYGPVHLAVRG